MEKIRVSDKFTVGQYRICRTKWGGKAMISSNWKKLTGGGATRSLKRSKIGEKENNGENAKIVRWMGGCG